MAHRVLVVDDSKNARGILVFMLKTAGYETDEAGDGEEALDKARAHRPDLVVLDAMMPKKSGFQVLAELKADASLGKIPVVMLSAIAGEMPGRDWSRECSAERFIPKPFKVQDVISAIDQLLGKPAREFNTNVLRRAASK